MNRTTKSFIQLVAGFEIVEDRLLRTTVNIIRAIRLKALSLPGMVQYKSLGSLRLLKEISTILDSLGLAYFIVGGFAYDIKRGRITRYHGDLDFAVSDDGSTVNVEECFAHYGFVSVSQGSNCRIMKHGRSADIFIWHKTDDGCLVNAMKTLLSVYLLAVFLQKRDVFTESHTKSPQMNM